MKTASPLQALAVNPLSLHLFPHEYTIVVTVQALAMLESREVLSSMSYVLSNKQQSEGSAEREPRRCKQPRETEQQACRNLDGESPTEDSRKARHIQRRLQLAANGQVRFQVGSQHLQSLFTAANVTHSLHTTALTV